MACGHRALRAEGVDVLSRLLKVKAAELVPSSGAGSSRQLEDLRVRRGAQLRI